MSRLARNRDHPITAAFRQSRRVEIDCVARPSLVRKRRPRRRLDVLVRVAASVDDALRSQPYWNRPLEAARRDLTPSRPTLELTRSG